MGVLRIRTLLFGVYVRVPDFRKLPYGSRSKLWWEASGVHFKERGVNSRDFVRPFRGRFTVMHQVPKASHPLVAPLL